MRINYRYVLMSLCVVFVAFYAILYFYGIELKDLMANLLATLIAVLVIDKIIQKSKLQKSERSINYVKGRILGVYSDLIWRMNPPKDWQQHLRIENSSWDDYLEEMWELKEYALNTLVNLVDRYHYLIDTELENSILEIVGLLEDFVWVFAHPRTKKDVWFVPDIAAQTTIIVKQAIDTTKRHKLLDFSMSRLISWSDGEPPKILRRKAETNDVERQERRQYSHYERLLKESIEFRDACEKLRFKQAS